MIRTLSGRIRTQGVRELGAHENKALREKRESYSDIRTGTHTCRSLGRREGGVRVSESSECPSAGTLSLHLSAAGSFACCPLHCPPISKKPRDATSRPLLCIDSSNHADTRDIAMITTAKTSVLYRLRNDGAALISASSHRTIATEVRHG